MVGDEAILEDVLVMLQARTSSSRLPAKILLPVAGYPLAVLAAKRAGNTGLNVLVATSESTDDDIFCDTLQEHDINFYRGSLVNVLQRFVDATAHLGGSTIIVRLTGDNAFPDGALLEELIDFYRKAEVAYLCINGEKSFVPYGLSAELTQLKYIREANSKSTTDFEREHVTPFVKNKYGTQFYDQYRVKGYKNLRCTVDHYDDYILIAKVFSKFIDPINTTVPSLIKELADTEPNLPNFSACDRLVLGGAQLGMKYGINNSFGQMQTEEAKSLIKFCIKSGVSYIDTASGYGLSEEILGETLGIGWREQTRIITKISIPDNYRHSCGKLELDLLLDKLILQAHSKLKTSFIDVLLFHKMRDFSDNPTHFREYFSRKMNEGVIGALGVSVQSPTELIDALRYPEFSFIQLPFNLLDTRWVECVPKIKRTKKERKLTIHCRSVLLQGLIASSDPSLWLRAGAKSCEKILDWLDFHRIKNSCETTSELALRYGLSFNWIDAIVVGFDNKSQAVEGVRCYLKGPLPRESIDLIEKKRPMVPIEILDPSTWSK